MIFYFSGTGNSLYVAQKLQESENEKLIDITDAINLNRFKYDVKDSEKIGIVFPVYFRGLPLIVSEFIDKLEIESDTRPYVYAVITSGGSLGNADKILVKHLKKKNIELNSVFSIKMPGNYVMMYDVPTRDEQDLTLQSAEKQIEKIIRLLEVYKKGNFVSDRGYFALLTPLVYRTYGIYRKTKKFHATDSCISCGLCERICPSKAIEMTSGKPRWMKDKCNHCTACINRCPKKAIQYGNSTKKRGRYVNPDAIFHDMQHVQDFRKK